MEVFIIPQTLFTLNVYVIKTKFGGASLQEAHQWLLIRYKLKPTESLYSSWLGLPSGIEEKNTTLCVYGKGFLKTHLGISLGAVGGGYCK